MTVRVIKLIITLAVINFLYLAALYIMVEKKLDEIIYFLGELDYRFRRNKNGYKN